MKKVFQVQPEGYSLIIKWTEHLHGHYKVPFAVFLMNHIS